MSASTFCTVGKVGVNTAHVTCAEWVPDIDNELAGNLVVNLAGGKDYTFRFDCPGVPELAAHVGLGEFGGEWDKTTKAKAKAAEKAEAEALKAAEAEAKADDHKGHRKAHG